MTAVAAAKLVFPFGAVAVGLYAVFVYGLFATVLTLDGTMHPNMRVEFAKEKAAVYTRAA